MTKTLTATDVSTPVGEIRVVCDAETVVAAAFSDQFERAASYLDRHFGDYEQRPGVTGASGALVAYLDGDLDALDDVPVTTLGSPFQQDVWAALRQIPAGSTMTYAELATAAGHTNAYRAAGTANGANPVSIFVPCHRVVPATGGVGGYTGGPTRKAWLLHHEAM